MTALFAVKTRITFVALVMLCLSSKAQLTANFTGTPLSGCSPVVVNFTDQSTGNPNQWKWDLGNGTISFIQNPSATYFTPGQYTVKLIIHNAAGTADSITKTQYITVNAQPTVNFIGTPVTGCFPLPVQFTDQSTAGSGVINSWQWDFGDGASSALQNPAHTYAASGNYNVTLRVSNNQGCIKVLTKTQYVKISTGVHADFSNSLPASCSPPSTISFQNLSTGTGTLSYQWSFGDGGTSILTSPSHTYNTTGSFTVRLIVTNTSGCKDTITKANVINIGTIHAAFTSPDSVCAGSLISFTNTSAPVPSSVAWNFGDGTTSTLINPSKIYATSGPKLVRLVAFFGACSDTTYKTVIVKDRPTVAFTGSPLSSCKTPLTVSFTNQTLNGISFTWKFGDGSTSTLANPTHTYSALGNYDVTLISTNVLGCSDTLVKTAYVQLRPPQVTIDNLPVNECAPITHTFTATINSPEPVVSYLWDFGDGTTSAAISPTHSFPTGTYTIRLYITTASGCIDSAVVAPGIIASDKPVANFSATPRDVCAHLPVQFTDLSTGNATRWSWTFGDGGSSAAQNPVHIYEDTGYFSVQLIAWNNGCPDTIRFVNYIHINPPIANFITSFNCSDPKIQTFTDQSIGADQWNWDFGDGTTSTLQNPVHTYASTGMYGVTLLVRNFTTGCEYAKTLPVNVVVERADFIAADTTICRNTPADFSAIGNAAINIVSYDWDFGDGATGTGANPSHSYANAGTYTVQLIITDVIGCKDTLIKPLYIEVDGPTSNFSSSVPGSCLMSAVVFNDHSTGDGVHPITTWTWNYGDGTIEVLTAPPFQHAYAAAGVYTVTLTVTDSEGCTDTYINVSAINISKPVAGFSSADTLSCPTKPINFSNSSTGPGLNYNWDFGDGTGSITATPAHSYAADGVYTVMLVITDQYGCKDTLTRPNYITIISPHAGFNMSDSVGTCPPLFVSFTNTSQNYTAVNWDFGDGTSTLSDNPSHFYSIPGIYFAKLTITSPGGCIDTIQKQITLRGPLGSFTYGPLNGCMPVPVNFTAVTQDRLSFIWDFNDGTITSTTDSIITHNYTIPGAYIPKMILIDPGGCQVAITGPDTIFVKGVVAHFNYASQPICDSGLIVFTDSSHGNDIIVNYAWKFGDGAISALQSPTHFYGVSGTYSPQLIVTTLSGCKDTSIAPVPVKIVASPQADFSNTGNGCSPLTVSFNGLLNVPDTSTISWRWVFGNGNTGDVQNPPVQLYNSIGTYNVQLIAINSTGCKDTVTKTVDVYPVPTINAGLDTLICRGSGITLTASGADNYSWSPVTGLSCTNCANPVASPDSLTRYVVRGTTLLGCSNTDTIDVKVKQRFLMRSSLGDTLCKGGFVRLFASGAYSYTWSPSTALSSANSATPIASPSATTIYRVIGTDDRNCFKDTGFVTVKVYPIPTVEAGQDKTINVGQSIELIPAISPDVTNVIWTPTASIVRSNYPAVTVKPNETTDYTVEVRNPGGCKTKDHVTIFVVCNGANVFIPNTFSPNGDGANDIFYPRGTGLFRIKTMRIFNRWGEVVYEKNGFMPNDASSGWNGTHQGQKLTPDVYVYTIEIVCDNSGTLTFKGNVTLIQ